MFQLKPDFLFTLSKSQKSSYPLYFHHYKAAGAGIVQGNADPVLLAVHKLVSTLCACAFVLFMHMQAHVCVLLLSERGLLCFKC